jgi:hypothetical protein
MKSLRPSDRPHGLGPPKQRVAVAVLAAAVLATPTKNSRERRGSAAVNNGTDIAPAPVRAPVLEPEPEPEPKLQVHKAAPVRFSDQLIANLTAQMPQQRRPLRP